VLSNPIKAAKNSKEMFFEKCLFVLVIILTILIINDLIAIGVKSQLSDSDYKYTITVLLNIFNSGILAGFFTLYILFIILIRSDP
jgi:hypothetical protein